MRMSGAGGPLPGASDHDAIATIHAALDAGINLLDTGDFYGMGHNEMLVGQALRGRRDQAVISVKFGAQKSPGGTFVGFDTRPASVKNFAAYSLNRLGVDVIDIYQPARVSPDVPIEDTVGAVADLIREGKVRFLGMSEANADQLRRAHAVHPVTALEIEYSLATRMIEAEILPTARELGVGIVGYGVVAQGLLLGDMEAPLPVDDPRAKLFPRFQGENLVRNLERVAVLKALAAARGCTPAQLAIAWVLSRGDDIVPLIGMSRPSRLPENLAALELRLSDSEQAVLDQTFADGAIVGDRQPSQFKHLVANRAQPGSRSLPRTGEGTMYDMKAVQIERYGDVDGLEVRRVPRPSPKDGEVLVQVKAAGINPGETVVRRGIAPGPLPSGQGVDLAGVVAEVGPGVDAFKVGDEVLGFTLQTRASQAEFAIVPTTGLTAKPAAVSWDVAGALFTAGATAYAAVRAVELKAGDTIAISAASGGVGTIAVQLAKRAGATVLGIAGPSSDDWLVGHGTVPVNYGDGLAARLRAAAPEGRVDAFLDFFGGGYVELAVDELGVPPGRVNTTIDIAALTAFPVRAQGNLHAAKAEVMAELARLIADGELEVPIAAVYPLDQVRDAYRALERRHTRGKIVLRP
jgi:aryl-alcohol dehydrogenase-like predicted oxidoreductase/NADPH:quinone reductase-like Zn-dependent oxidoreductase